jgi:ABC-type uncharacterized transport system fused permease/ATPase subunit
MKEVLSDLEKGVYKRD